jgi:argininosuccinate lyase/amino-acid N-acetyltransferase
MIMANDAGTQARAAELAFAVHAAPIHAASVARLIGYWADHGLTIRRDLRQIVTSIDDFVVAIHDERVVGCGALETISVCSSAFGGHGGIGEIRSIAVDAAAGKIGAGRAVMDALVAKAMLRGIGTLVLLTKIPDFFARFGFEAIERDAVPADYAALIAAQSGRTFEGKTIMRRILTPAAHDQPLVTVRPTAIALDNATGV